MGMPPRPPAPPAPPRSSSHIVAIALLILALIVVVSFIAVWTGLRFLSRTVRVSVEEGGGGKKEVSIKTLVGSLEVRESVDESRLGLPIYPGATRLENEGSATVSLDLPHEENLRVLAVKFESPDPLEKVRDFYKERLGSEVTRFVERTKHGATVFEIKREGQEKVVVLESRHGRTEIQLVRVTHGREETN